MCNCRWTETIVAVLIIVFSVIVKTSWSMWVVFVLGLVLLIHAFSCKNCGARMTEKSIPKPKSKKK